MFIQRKDKEEVLMEYFQRAGFTMKSLNDATNGNYLIFGGAIRDALSGEDMCKDIDILVKDKTVMFDGYIKTKDYDGDYNNGMDGRRIKHKNFAMEIDLLYPTEGTTFYDYVSLIKEVDINVCGIGWNHKFGFIECVPDAIKYCERKIFKVNKDAKGYSAGKSDMRIENLLNNDWIQI